MVTEKYLGQLKDTIVHKKLVLDSAYLMAAYLFNNGRTKIALNLLRRASMHDNSKFYKGELVHLVQIYDNAKPAFKDPSVSLSDTEASAIQCHWNNNKHHPEHFDSPEKMSELDIFEMFCDWHARSVQFGTDLLNFVTVRQEERFKFSDKMFSKIYRYCEIILDEEKKSLEKN